MYCVNIKVKFPRETKHYARQGKNKRHSLLQNAVKTSTIFEPTQNANHLSIRHDRKR